MIARRTFLKSIGALPVLLLGKEVVKPEVCKADETCRPEAGSEFPVIYQYWRNRWWRAQGNKIEWTEIRYHPLYHPTDDEFVNSLSLTDYIDWIECLLPYRYTMFVIQKHTVVQILPNSMFYEDAFDFYYRCQRKDFNEYCKKQGINRCHQH